MRFSGSRITAHSGFFRSLPTQVEITLSTSIKQTTTHHGQVSRKCQISHGAEGNPVLCGNIQLWMLLYTCPPCLVYDMASKYCNIKGKRKISLCCNLLHQIILDYCPPYGQNEKNLVGEKTTGPKWLLLLQTIVQTCFLLMLKQKLIKQIKMDSLKQTLGIDYSSSWRVSKWLKQDLGKKGVTLIQIKSIIPYNALLHINIWSSTEETSCMSACIYAITHTHTELAGFASLYWLFFDSF